MKTTNETPNCKQGAQDVCTIDLYAGDDEKECHLYLSPSVYVPLQFQFGLRQVHSNQGGLGLMLTATRLFLPYKSMDFVRRDSGIVDVHFRLPNVTVTDSKECPFEN